MSRGELASARQRLGLRLSSAAVVQRTQSQERRIHAAAVLSKTGRGMARGRRSRILLLLVALTAWPLLGLSADETPANSEINSHAPEKHERKPASVKISGYGFLGDLQLKRAVRLLVLGGKKPD